MARVSLGNVLLRGVSFTAAVASICLIFILLTSFAPPQDAGAELPAAAVFDDDRDGFPPPPPEGQRELVVRVFLQGYYINDGDKKLRQARDHVDGSFVPRFTHPQSDRVTISLHKKDDYGEVPFSTQTALHVTGYTPRIQIPNDIEEEVWVSVRHRNHLETVYFETIDLGAEFQQEYIELDFTTAASKAYGNNQMHLGGGVYGIYGGDVNGFGVINILDRNLINDAYLATVRGYVDMDVNGDGVVNIIDRNIVNDAYLRTTVVQKPN